MSSETTVIVVDGFDNASSRTLVYSIAEKGEFINLLNDAPAPLLAQLQRHEGFRGRIRWSELEHDHYRTLIALHLTLIADLRPTHRDDRSHPVVRSLDHLLNGYIAYLERRIGGIVTSIVVTRITPLECRYAVTTLLDHGTLPLQRPHGLRVVVNNS